MDSIPDLNIVRIHPDTVRQLRKTYNLDRPGEMDNAITALEDWLKKQHHLTRKEYPRSYLERSIILQKGSLERTKAQINNICAMRTLLPTFFTEDKQGMDLVRNGVYQAGLLPTLTDDKYRVIVLKMIINNINSRMLFQVYKNAIRTTEYLRSHDYCSGVVFVMDYRDVNVMDHIAVTNLTNFYHMLKIMIVGYHIRLKGIHVLTVSRAINAFIDMTKKMTSSKVSDRIHIHTNLEELYEYVPRDILPSELGGYERSLASLNDEWQTIIHSEKMIEFRELMSQAKSTEANKLKDTISDTEWELSGSFRYLNVD